jgi:hypothetical protein
MAAISIRRIPIKYFALVPAIYFASLGLFDIGMDLYHHTIYAQTWRNLILFIPLIFRHSKVYIVTGILLTLLWAYLLFVLFVWFLQYMQGKHFIDPAITFGFGGLFIGFSLFCSLAMLYAGRKL